MSLAEILEKYFGCKKFLLKKEVKDGDEMRDVTVEAFRKYEALTALLYDLEKIAPSCTANDIVEELDDIMKGRV